MFGLEKAVDYCRSIRGLLNVVSHESMVRLRGFKWLLIIILGLSLWQLSPYIILTLLLGLPPTISAVMVWVLIAILGSLSAYTTQKR